MPYQAPPELAALSLVQIAEELTARRLPPVEQWNPPETADSLMRIDASGQWYHDGRPDHPRGDGARVLLAAAA